MPRPSAHHYSSLLTPNAMITGLLTTLGTSGLAAHIPKIPLILHNSAHFHISTIPDNPFQICAGARAGVSAGPGGSAPAVRAAAGLVTGAGARLFWTREKVPWPEQRSFKVQTFCNISIPLNWSLVAQYCLTCSRLY